MRSNPEHWHRRTLRYYIQALPADQYDVCLVAPGKPMAPLLPGTHETRTTGHPGGLGRDISRGRESACRIRTSRSRPRPGGCPRTPQSDCPRACYDFRFLCRSGRTKQHAGTAAFGPKADTDTTQGPAEHGASHQVWLLLGFRARYACGLLTAFKEPCAWAEPWKQ